MGREGLIEFNIWSTACIVCFECFYIFCYVGVMRGIFLNRLIGLIYLFIFVLIIRLNYLTDNSVIFPEG